MASMLPQGANFSSPHDVELSSLDTIPAISERPLSARGRGALPQSGLDQWEMLEELGAGATSTVYRARHAATGQQAAVKILHSYMRGHDESVLRFKQEAAAMRSVAHPNVVAVNDCGMTADGQAYIIMDYLNGKSLSHLIRREGCLPAERAINIFQQICHGLGRVHTLGIIHRDLKPSNVMLVNIETAREFVKIVDFGLAKVISDDNEAPFTKLQLTKPGDVFGSPLYMSPEQCLGQELDERSDIYSLGCLMFETLTGEVPFMGRTHIETMYQHVSLAPPPLVVSNTERILSDRIQAIVFKCLEKDPINRYQSVAELKQDLILAVEASKPDWLVMAKASHQKIPAITGVRKANTRRHQLVKVVFSLGIAACLSLLFLGLFAVQSQSKSSLTFDDSLKFWKFDSTDVEIAHAVQAARRGAFDEAASLLINVQDETDCAVSVREFQRWVCACGLLGDLYRLTGLARDRALTPASAEDSRYFCHARDSYLKVIARCQQDPGANPENIARAQFELARLYEQYGLLKNSESAYQLALMSAENLTHKCPELSTSIATAYGGLLSRTDPVAALILQIEQWKPGS